MLGLEPDRPLVVFVGTIRPHKGVDLLIACADRIGNARIAVVGVERPMEAPDSVMVVPPVDYRVAMRWLAAADVVAIHNGTARSDAYKRPPKPLTRCLWDGRSWPATCHPSGK